MSKRIGFDAARLQAINPGAYALLPKKASLTGALTFYYTAFGDLRGTDGNFTYSFAKGGYSAKRKRFSYSWVNVSDQVGKNKKKV